MNPMPEHTPMDLEGLEKVARSATQARWFRSGSRNDLYDGKRAVNGHGIGLEGSQEIIAHVFFDKQTGEGFNDANHIATFDPPTVLALIGRLKAAEAQVRDLRGEVWPISTDGPHKITEHRRWLARQLMDSKLSEAEAYGIVAHSPALRSSLEEGDDHAQG